MLPVPTLDHVIVNVREGMKPAAEQYRRLGFTLTPLGRHTLGSINHLAMFGTDYLELLGIPPGSSARTELSDGPAGLSGVAFGTHDRRRRLRRARRFGCTGAAAAGVLASGRTAGRRARRRVSRGAHPARPRGGPVLLLWPPDARRGVARRVAPACQRRAGHRRHRDRGGAAGHARRDVRIAVRRRGGGGDRGRPAARAGADPAGCRVAGGGAAPLRRGGAGAGRPGRGDGGAGVAHREPRPHRGGACRRRDCVRARWRRACSVSATEACGVALEFAE